MRVAWLALAAALLVVGACATGGRAATELAPGLLCVSATMTCVCGVGVPCDLRATVAPLVPTLVGYTVLMHPFDATSPAVASFYATSDARLVMRECTSLIGTLGPVGVTPWNTTTFGAPTVTLRSYCTEPQYRATLQPPAGSCTVVRSFGNAFALREINLLGGVGCTSQQHNATVALSIGVHRTAADLMLNTENVRNVFVSDVSFAGFSRAVAVRSSSCSRTLKVANVTLNALTVTDTCLPAVEVVDVEGDLVIGSVTRTEGAATPCAPMYAPIIVHGFVPGGPLELTTAQAVLNATALFGGRVPCTVSVISSCTTITTGCSTATIVGVCVALVLALAILAGALAAYKHFQVKERELHAASRESVMHSLAHVQSYQATAAGATLSVASGGGGARRTAT